MSATIDLDLVSAFVAVGESASFSTAAKRLGVTTATVSRSIARLEEVVGTQLVHRTTRRVSLSTAGQALFERSASHVRAVRAALQNLPERQEEPAGTLRLTAPYDVGVTILADVITRFAARYPRVQVDADLTNRTVDIVAEGFDLAIRAGSALHDSSLTMRRLITSDVRCYASPAYLARRGSPRAVAAADHDWVVFGPLSKRLKLPAELRPRIIANDVLFLREAVRGGAGVGLLPAFIAEPLVTSGELVVVLPSVRIQLRGGLVMLYPATGPVAPKVRAFRDLLVATLKNFRST